MNTPLPKSDELKISSLEEATDILKLVLQKIEEIEEREPIRDTGLVEEILHLRKDEV